jgi:predicted DNA binding CopG/RHH family protein
MKKIKTGNVDVGPNEFNPKKGKFRVNMFIDLDVVEEIRKTAEKKHVPYQTLINQKLREIFMNEQSIEDRVSRIEKIIFNKRSGT